MLGRLGPRRSHNGLVFRWRMGGEAVTRTFPRDSNFKDPCDALQKWLTVSRRGLSPEIRGSYFCHRPRPGGSAPWLIRQTRRLVATRRLALCLNMKVRYWCCDTEMGSFWSRRGCVVRSGSSYGAHERENKHMNRAAECMRLATTSPMPVPGAGAAPSSRTSLPKLAAMAVAAFGVVALASVALSRQDTAVEQRSTELSKHHSSKGSDEGELY